MRYLCFFIFFSWPCLLFAQGSYYPSTGMLSECNVTYKFYKAAQYDYDFHKSSNGTIVTTSIKISIKEGKGTILIYWPDTGKKDRYNIDYAYRDKEKGDYYFTVEGNSNLSMRLSKKRIDGSVHAFELMSKRDNSVIAFFNN